MKLITIDMDALAKAIDCNTDATERDARSIINAVLYKQAPAATEAPTIGGSTFEQVFAAIDLAHDLGGPLHERIRALAEQRASPAPAVGAPDERAAFEAEFPVPGGVHWDGTEYVVSNEYINSYRADRFVGQWKAWQRRAALLAAPASVQPVQADPLQGAANWLVKALVPCSAIEIGWRLSIGHNRAQRLRDNATGVQTVPASLSDEQMARRLAFMCDTAECRYIEGRGGMWRVYADIAPVEAEQHEWRAMTTRYYPSAEEAIDAALASSTPTKGGQTS